MRARGWIISKHHGAGKPPGNLDRDRSNRLSWDPLPGSHLQLLAVAALQVAPLLEPVFGRHVRRRFPKVFVLDQHNIERDGTVLIGICVNTDVEVYRAGPKHCEIGGCLGLALDAGTGGAPGTDHQQTERELATAKKAFPRRAFMSCFHAHTGN